MSMHEVEDLIEQSIRLVNQSDQTAKQKRQLIWSLYDIQGMFDCSYTHFRLIDTLLALEYMQTFTATEFPAAQQYTHFYHSLSDKPSQFISHNPTLEGSGWGGTNQVIAFWDAQSQRIFIEYGSPYHTLHTNETPVRQNPYDTGLAIIQLTQDADPSLQHLSYDWALFMVCYLPDGQVDGMDKPYSASALIDQYFCQIKPIVHTALHQHPLIKKQTFFPDLADSSDYRADWFDSTQQQLLSYLEI